ncbi:hypothetical protein BGZ89_009915 [Linnemannia elongata]|nr:hypothetical protein BGZ89_009915 [Linnemannia elongata]KAG0064177.1 hypothetical protein BGZ90_002320 [Linnemannia elongata]
MSTYIRPVLSTEGRLGHLTPDQNLKLQEFWVRLYEIFDGKVDFDQTAPPSFKGQGRDADVSSLYSPAAPLTSSSSSSSSTAAQAQATPATQNAGWFGGGFGPSAAAGFVDAVSSDTVMSDEAPRFTGKQLHRIFWKITMMDHPDLVVLKYIRARKWVIDDALKMVLNALKWRVVEQLDELVELSDAELDAKYPKFIEQLKSGKGYLRGADPLGRPMSIINTRLHHKSDQPPETIHRYTLYTMECGRTVLETGAESVIVIFDLSDFGLDNMDWGFIRLFVQCFEAYYPETLGVCVIHKAPYVFWGIWKLIQPLLDPVVTAKFVFTRNNADLHKVIPRERLPVVPYDGLDDWKYEYIPAQEGENDCRNDVVKREELLNERHELESRFETVSKEWCLKMDGSSSAERDAIAAQLKEQYTRLWPYVRAVNMYQRWGAAQPTGVNWTYNLVEDMELD